MKKELLNSSPRKEIAAWISGAQDHRRRFLLCCSRHQPAIQHMYL